MKSKSISVEYRKGGQKGLLGIWMKKGGTDYLVNPYALADSLCADEHQPLDLYEFASINGTPDYDVYLNISMTVSEVNLRFDFSSQVISVSLEDYFAMASAALAAFCEDSKKSVPIVYGGSIDDEHLKTIESQVTATPFLFGPHKLTIDDINIEEFSLTFDNKVSCDINFIARIGNRTIESCISDWSTDLDYIRHQMEGLVFGYKSGEIEINFEDEPTKIRFIKRNVLTNTKKVDGGTTFQYKDLLQVQILPNTFTKTPAVVGFCEPMPTIRAMYESLLQLGRILAAADIETVSDWNYSSGMNIYNTLKSGIVEAYLTPYKPKSEVVKRQTIVRHIVTICGRDDTYGYHEDGSSIYVIKNAKDLICIDGLADFTVNSITDWIKQRDEAGQDFDAEKWDIRGLEFARQIRSLIPEDYDVWYESSAKKLTLIL